MKTHFLFNSSLSSLKGRQADGLNPETEGFWDVTLVLCQAPSHLQGGGSSTGSLPGEGRHFLSGPHMDLFCFVCNLVEPWALHARQVLYHEVLYFNIEAFILEWGGLTDIE